MAGDNSNYLIGHENWESKIPLHVTLAQNEITTVDGPMPLYVQAYRMAYLVSVIDEILPYFRHVLPPGEDTPWFDADGLPLLWQVPLGVMHDLLTAGDQKPWRLTVHFREFPKTTLSPWNGMAGLKAAYLNSLKEAAYIGTGSSAPVLGMASDQQNELWKSVETCNFGQYFRVSEASNLSVPRREGKAVRVPVRIYMKRGRGRTTDYLNVHYTSRPIETLKDNPSQPTLGSVLESILPEYFETKVADDGSIGETASVSSATQSKAVPAEAAARGQAEEEGHQWLVVGKSGKQRTLQLDGKEVSVTVCGISPKLETPLAWLHSQLRHPDHFLYVVLHV